jgi:parallel beta-helix repeat protein
MSRKPFYSLLFLVVLMGVSSVSFNVHNVEAPYPIVYIEAEGSIDPPTANITSPDNVTYTFTADINASIVVERDNIVVDGAGYTVQGGGDGTGIDLSGRSNVTIKNMKIKTFGTGIYLYESSDNMISGNVITDNGLLGVHLYLSSNNNTVSANTITNNYRGIWLEVSTGTSSNNVISRNNIENNTDGIMIYRSLGNIISENNVTKNRDHSTYLDTSYDNRIYHNNFIDNGIPWYFYFSTNTWDAGYPLGGNYWSDYNGTDLFSGLYQNETSSDGIGVITALSTVVVAFIRIPGGYIADRFGRKKIIVTMTFTVALAYHFYAFAPSWEWILIGALINNFCLIYQPALMAMRADSVSPENRGIGFALADFLPMLVSIPAPMISGYLVSTMGRVDGMRLIYLATVGMGVVGAVIRLLLKETLPEKSGRLKQKAFVDFAKTLRGNIWMRESLFLGFFPTWYCYT